MDASKKWKSRLLSSSIPLEFEAAKVLVDQNMSISYDYSFPRKEGADYKEFSCDLKGLGFVPLNNDDRVDAIIELLVECKYRDEGKGWVFLPELDLFDFSNQTLGYATRGITSFSKKIVSQKPIYDFEQIFSFSPKGVEVNFNNGDVFDKDIRHGILQLKYALPYLIRDAILENVYGHIDDAIPRFIVPILVTNADLYLINKEFSIESLKKCNEIEEIAEKVPYLLFYSDIGSDFTEHHKRIFKNFYDDVKGNTSLFEFENYQFQFKDRYGIYQSPIRECEELENSYRSILLSYYTHFIICSFDHFKTLVRQIFSSIEQSVYMKND